METRDIRKRQNNGEGAETVNTREDNNSLYRELGIKEEEEEKVHSLTMADSPHQL